MKDLKIILTEGFFKNVGAQPTLADAITQGKSSIRLQRISSGKIKDEYADITKTGPKSIHVDIKRGDSGSFSFRLTKNKFDIDFSDYYKVLYNLVKGDFSKLSCRWNSTIGHYDGFMLEFRNKDFPGCIMLEYIVRTGVLTRCI